METKLKTKRIKTGGRKKGTPNRTTQQMREVLQTSMNKNLKTLEADLKAMSPINRWLILTKLMSYVMPTLSKNDNTNTNAGNFNVTVTYVDKELP